MDYSNVLAFSLFGLLLFGAILLLLREGKLLSLEKRFPYPENFISYLRNEVNFLEIDIQMDPTHRYIVSKIRNAVAKGKNTERIRKPVKDLTLDNLYRMAVFDLWLQYEIEQELNKSEKRLYQAAMDGNMNAMYVIEDRMIFTGNPAVFDGNILVHKVTLNMWVRRLKEAEKRKEAKQKLLVDIWAEYYSDDYWKLAEQNDISNMRLHSLMSKRTSGLLPNQWESLLSDEERKHSLDNWKRNKLHRAWLKIARIDV